MGDIHGVRMYDDIESSGNADVYDTVVESFGLNFMEINCSNLCSYRFRRKCFQLMIG
jgi:hypothetical protein